MPDPHPYRDWPSPASPQGPLPLADIFKPWAALSAAAPPLTTLAPERGLRRWLVGGTFFDLPERSGAFRARTR